SPGRCVTDVFCASKQNDDFGIDSIQLAVLQTPQDVLRPIGTPSEISRVPAEEILLPIGEQVGVVDGAPSSCDRVTFKVDVDPAMLRLPEQLRMSDQRVRVGSEDRLVGR